MAEIDISNIINVSISDSPISMRQANTSALACVTEEQAPNGEPYIIYRSPVQVATDFGSASEVYKQAVAVFAQAPNILTANGYFVVLPALPAVTIPARAGYAIIDAINLQNFRLVTDGSVNIGADGGTAYEFTGLNFTGANTTEGVAAVFQTAINASETAGTATTGDITASNFASVEDGSFGITVDLGSTVSISGLDFTGTSTVADIATVISAALTTAEAGATCSAVGDTLVFTSATTGDGSSVILSSDTTGTNLLASDYFGETLVNVNGRDKLGVTAAFVDGHLRFTSDVEGGTSAVTIEQNTTGTDLTGVSYLDTDAAVFVQGVEAYSGRERLVDTLIRCKPLVYFSGILVDHSLDPAYNNSELLDASNWVQSEDKMLYIANNDITCCDSGEIFDIIRGRNNHHTRCLAYFKDTAQSARLMAAAYASRGQSVDFGGSNTTLTMQLKTLATIDPDPAATETLVQKAKVVGADMYVSVDGVPCVFSNGANEFFDNVYNDIWLKTALQVAGFNALRNAASKIPQTAAGVEILVKAYTDVLNTGIKNGAFAAGKWTLPVTFGDPQMLKDAVESVGYYVYATPIEEQAQSEREERKAPFIQMAIKRAGAIHTSDILVYINN